MSNEVEEFKQLILGDFPHSLFERTPYSLEIRIPICNRTYNYSAALPLSSELIQLQFANIKNHIDKTELQHYLDKAHDANVTLFGKNVYVVDLDDDVIITTPHSVESFSSYFTYEAKKEIKDKGDTKIVL